MKYLRNKMYDKFMVKFKIENTKLELEAQGKMGSLKDSLKFKNPIIMKQNIIYSAAHADSRIIMGKFKNNLKSVINGHFVELQLIGLGYAVYRVNDTLVFDIGYSHFISYMIEKDIIIKLEGQTLILYSMYHEKLKTFISNLKNIKKVNMYKGTGLVNKDEKLKLKKGKIR